MALLVQAQNTSQIFSCLYLTISWGYVLHGRCEMFSDVKNRWKGDGFIKLVICQNIRLRQHKLKQYFIIHPCPCLPHAAHALIHEPLKNIIHFERHKSNLDIYEGGKVDFDFPATADLIQYLKSR